MRQVATCFSQKGTYRHLTYLLSLRERVDTFLLVGERGRGRTAGSVRRFGVKNGITTGRGYGSRQKGKSYGKQRLQSGNRSISGHQ